MFNRRARDETEQRILIPRNTREALMKTDVEMACVSAKEIMNFVVALLITCFLW